jgi:hypothetical protein
MDINQWTGELNKPVFYTKEMAKRVREIKQPVYGLQMDIVKFPEFLAIRLYENNFMQYGDAERIRIIDYIEMVKKVLESYGVRVELEGAKGERIL